MSHCSVWPGPASGAVAAMVAFVVDAAFGEPPARWHPVVWAGRALSLAGAPWPTTVPRAAFLRGMAVWLLGAVTVTAFALLATVAVLAVAGQVAAPIAAHIAVLGAAWFTHIMVGLLLGCLLKPLLAWRLLREEVLAVESALSTSLDAGRERLKFLVSRDTAALNAVQVRESALESLAENLNDSFVAPLFWFVLGGLPAAALYRFANTADAMWGYRGQWEWAGKWSARADDVLSYAPARLTAVLIAIAAGRRPRALRREASRTPSPNGGWPMAMMALALDVRLSKPGVYTLHADGRLATADDMRRGLRVAEHAAWLAVVAAVAVSLVFGLLHRAVLSYVG